MNHQFENEASFATQFTVLQYCYTNSLYYFIALNSIPNILPIDQSLPTQSSSELLETDHVAPKAIVSPNLSQKAVTFPDRVFPGSIVNEFRIDESLTENDKIFIAAVLPKKRLLNSFLEKFHNDCNFNFKVDASINGVGAIRPNQNAAPISRSPITDFFKQNDIWVLPRVVSYNYSSSNFTDIPVIHFPVPENNPLSFEIQIFSSDVSYNLYFAPPPSSICYLPFRNSSGPICHETISKETWLNPPPGRYGFSYFASAKSPVIKLSKECPQNCHQEKNYGKCELKHYTYSAISSGVCSCHSNRQGYNCEIDALAIPKNIQMLEIVLLSLSNLSFIPVIYLTYGRKFYTLSLVFILVTITSVLYHTCNQENTGVYICVLPNGIETLQFMDFTITTVSILYLILSVGEFTLPKRLSLGMLGSIVIIFFISYNKYNMYFYIGLSTASFFLLMLTWWYQNRMPIGKVWRKKYLPGIFCFIIAGLCIGLLESDYTYWYVHSVWHFFLGLGVLFLVPKSLTVQDHYFYNQHAAANKLPGNQESTYISMADEIDEHNFDQSNDLVTIT